MAACRLAKNRKAVPLCKNYLNHGFRPLFVSYPDNRKRQLSVLKCVLQARTFFNASKLSVAYYYDVILHTGNRFGAGTDANVFMKLYGERGSTDEIQLPSKKGDLERGMINKYKVSANDLGNLKKIDIRHDNKGLGPAWFLEKVTVRDHSGSRFIFDCGEWLLKRSGEDTLKMELALSEQNLDQLSSYKGISMDYAKLTEDEHLNAVEETVHKNLSGVLQGIIETDHNSKFQDSMTDFTLPDSGGLDDKNISLTDVLMLPSARLLVEAFGLMKQKIPSTGPKGHLLKEDVLRYVSLNKITRPQQKMVVPTVKEPVKSKKSVSMSQTQSTSSNQQKVNRTPDIKFSENINRYERFEDVNCTLREKIASEQYMLSKSTIPHIYSTYECNIDNVTKIQDELSKKGATIPTDAFLLKATALALKAVPEMNVNYADDGTITNLSNVDIVLTLISEQTVVKPVLKDVYNLRLKDIAEKLMKIEEQPHDAHLNSKEVASFSFSNLGSFGVSQFSEIITPPQVCMMSVGKPITVLSADKNLSKTLTVTLSYDGRLISETTASLFTESFRKFIENPSCYIG